MHIWLVPHGSTFTNSRPAACSLVPEFGKERVPSGVVDRAGQHSLRKSFDVEVFHPDQPVTFHQPAAEIMMKGSTLVSDFTVRPGHQCGGLAAAMAAALATGKPAACVSASERNRLVATALANGSLLPELQTPRTSKPRFPYLLRHGSIGPLFVGTGEPAKRSFSRTILLQAKAESSACSRRHGENETTCSN
jgi:hypothetical protein